MASNQSNSNIADPSHTVLVRSLADGSQPQARWTLHRANGEAVPAQASDRSVRGFLERLVHEGRSLEGADLDRLAEDLRHDNAFDLLDDDGRIDLRSANLRGGDLRGIKATCAAVDITLANLSSAWIDDADLTGVSLAGADLRGTRARRTRLAEADLQRADFGPDEDPPDRPPASIRFPAKDDAGRKAGRFLGHGIVLTGANLDYAKLENTQIPEANLVGALLRDATVEDACLDGARMSRLDLSRSTVTGSSIVSETAHEAITTHALLRNNAYARIPGLKEAILHPSRLIHMGGDERAQRAAMPEEMRKDYDGSVVVAAISTMVLPAGMAASHAADKMADWAVDFSKDALPALGHLMQSTSPHALLDTIGMVGSVATVGGGGEAASWLGIYAASLLPMVPSAALALGGAWVLKKVVDAAAEPLVRGATERINLAREFVADKKPLTAMACLVGWGTAANRIREAIVEDVAQENWQAFFAGQGTVAVVGEHTRLQVLLDAAGLLDSQGRLPNTTIGIQREGGPGWPEDPSPQSIEIRPYDRGCTATWRDKHGMLVRRIQYDHHGVPQSTSVRDGVFCKMSDEPVEAFRQRMDPVAAFMGGVRRLVAPYDGVTHVAKDGSGGIVIRRIVDGKIDNPMGPAVVTTEGDMRFFLDGTRVDGLETAIKAEHIDTVNHLRGG